MSRAKREARLQRAVLIATGIVVVAVIALNAYAFINQKLIIPQSAVATVNGEPITVTEFQEQALFQYYIQTGGQPLEQVGVPPEIFGQIALEAMIEYRILQSKADEMGITVSDEEIEQQGRQFIGIMVGLPIPPAEDQATSTPTPTPEGPTATPTPTSTFVYTPTPSTTPTLAPGVTPSPTPTLTPTTTPGGPPTATPTAFVVPTSEPVSDELVDQILTQFVDGGTIVTGIPAERIEELWKEQISAFVLKDKLSEALDFELDQTKVTVHAAHILVETEEEALVARGRILAGEDFGVVAAEMSTDSKNAYKGGDLGWFGPGSMATPFEDAAFDLPVGEISEPIETDYGWHIIKVFERAVVPTTQYEQDRQRGELFNEQLSKWREEADVVTEDDVWPAYLPEFP